MIRWLVALLATLVGAGMGAGLTAMALAILFTAIWGPFEGSAAMGGVTVGLPLGGLLGLGLGAWLALRFCEPRPDVPPQA